MKNLVSRTVRNMKTIGTISLLFLLFAHNASAACNIQSATSEFTALTQKLAQTNHQAFVNLQGDFKKLASDVSELSRSGKNDEICKRYNELATKIQASLPK